MYSPKIKEQHIPLLYKIAQVRQIAMTAVVDEALSFYLAQINEHAVEEEFCKLNQEEKYHEQLRAA